MFWGDAIIDDFLAEYGEEARTRPLILRDEKTLSGRPHVGSLRSFVLHAVLSDVLTSRGIDHAYFYEINDTDAFDSVPRYVPSNFKQYLGKRLCDVPSPDSRAENYAAHFANEYLSALREAKWNFETYRSSEKYASGEYDEYIRQALEKKDQVRAIYKEVSGSEKADDWYPCQVICDECGKIATTRIVKWDGKEVEYVCDADTGYTHGCGYRGRKSPFSGNATLPWKVEWAAKFCVLKVDLEGAGKDHYASGGSRLVSNRICEEVFGRKHPFDVRHEFILVSGAKMSSSAGTGAMAADVSHLLPRHILRFMMTQKDIMQTINFSPNGDTIPALFDQYDTVCTDYFSGTAAAEHKNRIFELTHFYEKDSFGNLNRFLPRFSQVAFFTQMPHVDIEKKFEEVKGSALTDIEKKELHERTDCARKWLSDYSPEKYVFKIQEHVPEAAARLSAPQKQFLHVLADFLKNHPEASGEEIQTYIHVQKDELGLPPKEIFAAIYISLLGKDSGPKAGWLMEALDNAFLLKRFSKI